MAKTNRARDPLLGEMPSMAIVLRVDKKVSVYPTISLLGTHFTDRIIDIL